MLNISRESSTPRGERPWRPDRASKMRWIDRILRGLGAVAATLLLLCLLALALYRPILSALGDFLVVGDEAARADFIFLLNGGLRVRPARAAELYRAGYAPMIVIARGADSILVDPDEHRSATGISLAILRQHGVPDSALVILPSEEGTASTADEADALARYLQAHPARRILVVTSDYHTRRTRWTLRRELGGVPVELRMIPAPEEFSGPGWWRSEEGFLAYLEEYLKFFHSWVRN